MELVLRKCKSWLGEDFPLEQNFLKKFRIRQNKRKTIRNIQIPNKINNWFGVESKKANLLWAKLNQDKPIKELASIPLLLTLFCIAFDETMEFPTNRAELYKEALDALLKKWDASRGIKRDEMYKNLSIRRKESMFSRIAAKSFDENEYYFKWSGQFNY